MNALSRYVLAAIFARTSTGASAVAIILLSRHYGADGTLLGALTACITAPHIFGPIYGRWCEKANNAFNVIAGSCVLFSLFFLAAIASIASQHFTLALITLLFCGACSSFMMGGLSTQIIHLVEVDPTVRRKAQSWDTLTYGIGLTLGPVSIALLSSYYSINVTVTLVMLLPIIASLIILSLPKPRATCGRDKSELPSFKQVALTLWQNSALRTTLLMTSSAAFSFAALPVIAIYYSELFNENAEMGAYLVTLYGIGCLCGGVLLIFRPLTKEALTLLKIIGLLLISCLLLVSVSSSFLMSAFAYWFCGVINSIFFAVTIAARTEYSPTQGAAQIYMWIAAAKITAASLGSFVAGSLVGLNMALPIVASITVLSITLLLCFVTRQNLMAKINLN